MSVINATCDAALRHLLVCHSENLRAFKDIGKNTLSVVFCSHSSSRNTQVIVSEYK